MGGPNPIHTMNDEKTVMEILEDVECPVIVEGMSDESALREFNVDDIVPLNGKPLFRVARSISERSDRAVILTDFDSEGRKLAGKLNEMLSSYGVTPIPRTRAEIERIVTKVGISTVENMSPDKV
ncbi:MAG: toprim domain-containing protein [Candidatus Aenigmatarchaeota archaeon]